MLGLAEADQSRAWLFKMWRGKFFRMGEGGDYPPGGCGAQSVFISNCDRILERQGFGDTAGGRCGGRDQLRGSRWA